MPVDEVMEIILDHFYPKGTSLKEYRYHGFKRLEFRRMLEYCLKGNTFIFNGQYYLQTDGVAMGSPLAPILADIFLNSVLDPIIVRDSSDTDSNLIKLGSFELKFFTRYVDDLPYYLNVAEPKIKKFKKTFLNFRFTICRFSDN